MLYFLLTLIVLDVQTSDLLEEYMHAHLLRHTPLCFHFFFSQLIPGGQRRTGKHVGNPLLIHSLLYACTGRNPLCLSVELHFECLRALAHCRLCLKLLVRIPSYRRRGITMISSLE